MSEPLIDAQGRVRDAAAEQRRARRSQLGRAGLALLVLAALVWAVTSTPLVAVRKVVVTGNAAVPTETLTQAAAIPLGTPLARVDVAGAEKRLAQVPGVGRGDVVRTFPDTITLRISERALAFVVADGARYAWVDPTGAVFSHSDTRPTGVPLAQADLADQALLADVGAVVGALPPKLAGRVKQVDAGSRDAISIATTEGTVVVWGSAEASPLKGQVADVLARRTPSCKRIDVSSPSHPVTRC